MNRASGAKGCGSGGRGRQRGVRQASLACGRGQTRIALRASRNCGEFECEASSFLTGNAKCDNSARLEMRNGCGMNHWSIVEASH